MNPEFFSFESSLALIWIGVWLLASLIYRLRKGKPILFFTVPGADYVHRFASGYSHNSLFARFGGATACLVVAIVKGRLIVRPWFPFNLFFVPEIFKLEHDFPLKDITSCELRRALVFNKLEIRFYDKDRQPHGLTLFVRKPAECMGHLKTNPSA